MPGIFWKVLFDNTQILCLSRYYYNVHFTNCIFLMCKRMFFSGYCSEILVSNQINYLKTKEVCFRAETYQLALAKGRTISKANYGAINSPKKRTKLTILTREDAQDSKFRSFFGRIEEAINCFWDLLTFRAITSSQWQSLTSLAQLQTSWVKTPFQDFFANLHHAQLVCLLLIQAFLRSLEI